MFITDQILYKFYRNIIQSDTETDTQITEIHTDRYDRYTEMWTDEQTYRRTDIPTNRRTNDNKYRFSMSVFVYTSRSACLHVTCAT